MKAITTKYHGPTHTKGSRISATDMDNNRIMVSVNSDMASFPYEGIHAAAAKALCTKMGWPDGDALIGGSVKAGMVWVFPPKVTR
jgi:hypothetical protein